MSVQLRGIDENNWKQCIEQSKMRGDFLIRDFKLSDIKELNFLINSIDTGYEMGNIKDIQKEVSKFIVYVQDNQIKGLTYTIISNDDVGEQVAKIWLYVEPKSRKQGIGSKLYNELEAYLFQKKPHYMCAYMRVDINNPEQFCKKMGFQKWWGSSNLYYDGKAFSDVNLEFSVYDDNYFEQFYEITKECYYPIHKSNDIKPYMCTKESVENFQLRQKENVFIALDNDQVVASVTIGDGEIENLMVSPKYQGKGYGKKALQFGTNKLLNQGHKEIHICYMESNTIAEKLHYSQGYRFLQNTHVYRKFL